VTAGGNAANDLLGAGRTSTAGTDVAGTIGGVAASGSGQTLTAGAGTPALGLAVEITGGATGDRASVSFGRGYAAKVGDLLDELLSNTGLLATTTDGVNRSIKDLDRQREALNRRLGSIETRYRKQFTALDTALSGMQSTSAFLAQQLAKLPGAAT
jgi:flagellar hook-associated protein 2